jgi:hypothetical protein
VAKAGEADWDRVLDCGAAGPGREAPRLFYQARGAAANDAPGDPGQE